MAEAAEACVKATNDEWLADENTLHDAMQLLAESSSALRVALRQTWLVQPDRDQDETHLWLRTEAWRRSIYVERFMSLDDPADPARAPEVTTEARTLVALLAGVAFAAHPVHVEAVTGVVGRAELLCALFCFAGAAIRICSPKLDQASSPTTEVIWPSATVICLTVR